MIGNTRLFLKYYHLDQMEHALKKFYDDVVRSQCAIRSYFARIQLRRLQERARMTAAERAAAEQRCASVALSLYIYIYIYVCLYIETLCWTV